MRILWFIPTHGDGRHLGTARGGRPATLPYYLQVAQAAESCGYDGALLPTGRSCDDSWVVAGALAAATARLRLLVAVRPGLLQPTVAARMTATLDRISHGRAMINVVTGGDPVELAGDGVFLGHDERYALTDEFLGIYLRLLRGEAVSAAGDHLRVEGASVLLPGPQRPPPIYFGGSSPAGLRVAGRYADVYLSWTEPPAMVAEKIAQARQAAAEAGRGLRFGLRLHVIVRRTAEQAWAAAEDLIRYIDDAQVAAAQATFARFDSVGQRRMLGLHAGSRRRLEISPNLWAGVGLVRGGAGTALVGDARTVADRLLEYRDLGVDEFILSGYPHLEEAYRTAELLFPLLPGRAGGGDGLAGEIVANHHLPRSGG